MSSTLNIKAKKIQTVDREKAKQLSLAFYDIYDDYVTYFAKEKESDRSRFVLIFKYTSQYFTYLDSCKDFIDYLIKLEGQLYRGKETFKCTEIATNALKETDAIKWIHEELNSLQSTENVCFSFIVSKLQNKNCNLSKTRPDFIKKFTSVDPEQDNSVTKFKNRTASLNSNNLKVEINPFIKLMTTLFESVLPPQGAVNQIQIISKQYSLPNLGKDYFTIIQELLDLYPLESSTNIKPVGLYEHFKQISNYIIQNQTKFKSDINSKNFQFEKLHNVHKHYVIEALTTFAINEENLTQLNYEALKAFFDHKEITDYLHYLDKLWLLKIPRENTKPRLYKDIELIIDEPINAFLDFTFGECLKRIHHYFLKNKTVDTQLAYIGKKFLAGKDLSINQLQTSIHDQVKKACRSFKRTNKIPLSRAISFANAWSNFNEKKSAYTELLSRAILRLIINLEDDINEDCDIVIKRAIEEELCCIHRQFYTHYLLGEILGINFQKRIEDSYENYQINMFSVFKLWLVFLITQKTLNESSYSIRSMVNEYFSSFINHSAKPASSNSFINSDKIDEQVPEVKTLININDVDFSIYVESSSSQFQMNKTLENELLDSGIELSEFEKFTSNEYLTHLWDELLGVDTKELVALSLVQNFIKVAGGRKKEGYNDQYLHSRAELKINFHNTRRDAFFKAMSSQTFSRIIFNYNKSFEDKLKNKIEVLSHVSSLESDRYDIENKLGQGAFGVVYKAKDLMFESIVAIKLIPHWFHSEGVSKRLIKEAAIMRNSQHENVVVVYDLVKLPAHKLTISEECKLNHLHVFDDNEEVFALVMEEINGGVTLEQHILSTDWKSLSYEQKLDFFQNICFGVKSLHNQGVVHGDIKPQNILVGKNGKPKIADFGVASSSGDKSIGITSPTFISINKLNGGKSEFQDDIYSLGMLLLYIFSPSIVNELKHKNVNELIVEKELLHLALLSLNANSNGEGYYKDGYLHRYTFPDSQILELMDDDIAEIFLEDPIAKHSYYKDIVHNIDINTFNDGGWDKPNRYLYSLLEVIFRCISTKGSKTKERLYNLVSELHPSNENYIHIEELYLNTDDVQDINELIFEIKSAANSDVLELNHNDYRCLKLPTYLNEVLTLENLEFYSKHINFEELCKISANYKLNDITFLGGTKSDNNNTFLWTVGKKLYKGSSTGLENYFGEALYKTKLLKVMGQTYGDLFSFVHDVLELETIPNRCLSSLINIQPCLSYKPFSLGALKIRDCSQYKLPEKLGENITLFDKVEEAFILYQEVLNVFLNSGKEVDIEFESDDDYANALSTGASTVEPPTFSGNVIEFNAKLTSGEQLSLIEDDNLIASINAFVSTKGSKSFNRFYGSCFDYQKLRKSVVEWKQLDNENAIDEYIDVKTQYIGSIEYELLQMYVRSGDKEIHIFSR